MKNNSPIFYSTIPKKYTSTHEWILLHPESFSATVGLTKKAVNLIGDIVFVELPRIGDRYKAQEIVGAVESVKGSNDVFCPVDGVVTETNSLLKDNPRLVNSNPEDQGNSEVYDFRLVLQNQARKVGQSWGFIQSVR